MALILIKRKRNQKQMDGKDRRNSKNLVYRRILHRGTDTHTQSRKKTLLLCLTVDSVSSREFENA